MGTARAIAAPIFVISTTGITTGVFILHNAGPSDLEYKDGAEYTGLFKQTPAEFLAETRPYSSQVVSLNSPEADVSFAAVGGNRRFGFASALATGDLVPQVGVENGLRSQGFHLAFSRYYTTIKNNSDQDLAYDLVLLIQPGELTLRGIRHENNNAHLRAEAFVDYRLLTPNGGSYDESTGRLFDYFADMALDNTISHSANVAPTLVELTDTTLSYATPGLRRSLSLPTIPAFGELTVNYDMYTSLNTLRPELGGTVRLGDPGNLVPGESGGVFLSSASTVPEPATFSLIGLGFIAVFTFRKR